MEEATEVQRAMGRYRLPKLDRVVVSCAGIIWIALGMKATSYGPVWIATGIVAIATTWLVPVVVINTNGIRLVRRSSSSTGVDVTKVYQPGPGDPVRIQPRIGKPVVLYGVNRDRVPGIVVLARNR